VAGIGTSLAKRIVSHRDQNGPFKSRKALLEVSGMGPRTFEQAAGFLRIASSENPLDASAVHPERYALVERIANDLEVPLASLIGNKSALSRIDRAKYKTGDVGDFTLNDILAELDKPGRDPRKSFEPPKFRDDVRELSDLKPGMELEGVVTNVAAFGAFVDVGVHQDGLVHISELADKFVKDPHEVVKVGDKIQVRVLEVDLERKRIGLSARKNPGARTQGNAPRDQRDQRDGNRLAQAQDRNSRQGPNQRGPQRPGNAQQGGRGANANANAPRTSGDGKNLSHNPFAAHFNKR
jgi:uncharacterized protein